MATKTIDLYEWYGDDYICSYSRENELIELIANESKNGNTIVLDFGHIRYVDEDFYYEMFLSFELHNDIEIIFANLDDIMYNDIKQALSLYGDDNFIKATDTKINMNILLKKLP